MSNLNSSHPDINIDEDNYFDYAEALHAWCNLNHGGQSSEIYAVGCQSQFSPGMAWRESEVEENNPYYSEITAENVSDLMAELNDFLDHREEV